MHLTGTGGGVQSNAFEFVNLSRDGSGEGRNSLLCPPLSATEHLNSSMQQSRQASAHPYNKNIALIDSNQAQ